jgi:hypothetical protein
MRLPHHFDGEIARKLNERFLRRGRNISHLIATSI